MSEEMWVAPVVPFTMDGNKVCTDGTHAEKVTGTAMGGLLGCSPYETPFSMTSKLMGLWDKDIGNKPQVVAGKLLEGRIIDYASKTYPNTGAFYKAVDIFGERTGAHRDWESDFEDDIFAGHVDGIVTQNGQDYILEVKTAGIESAKGWVDHPPEHYLWQVNLYNHFITKQDKAYMLLGVMDSNAYANPNGWIPSTSNTFLFEVKIDQKLVAETIQKVRDMYNDTVKKGISAPADLENPIDQALVQHFRDIQKDDGELNRLAEEYLKVRKANEEYYAKNKVNDDLEATLKDRLKDAMVCKDISKLGKLGVRFSERKQFDFKTADIDGFDYAKYVRVSKVATMTVDKDTPAHE